MDDLERPVGNALGMTALGRLHLRVPEDDGYEEVVVERRWPDASAARAWCERTLARSIPGTAVLEVQVFEERWHHRRSWETAPNRPIAETLQLGVLDGYAEWSLRWSETRTMTGSALRHVY